MLRKTTSKETTSFGLLDSGTCKAIAIPGDSPLDLCQSEQADFHELAFQLCSVTLKEMTHTLLPHQPLQIVMVWVSFPFTCYSNI